MKKTKYQTSRVHWRLGQALLPEHFYSQEYSLREESQLRWAMRTVPSWGIGSLQWDNFQLLEGTLSLQELTVILPSGALVDIPGNARPASFNLNATGLSEVKLYLHLDSDFDVARTAVGPDPDEGVERVVQKIILSIKPHLDTAVHSLELAHFAKTPDGQWQLNSDYLPPLMRVGTTPLFENFLGRLSTLNQRYHQQLVSEIQENYLSGQAVLAAKVCLKSIFKTKDGEIN